MLLCGIITTKLHPLSQQANDGLFKYSGHISLIHDIDLRAGGNDDAAKNYLS